MQVGAAIVASRQVVAEVPPLTLALLRYGIALLCLLPFVFKAFWPPAPAVRSPAATETIAKGLLPDLLPIAALGIGQFAILIALLNYGLQRIGAAQAALVFSLFPLLTLLLGALLGHERIRAPLLAGVLLSIGGVGLSLAPKLSASQGAAGFVGELAVLAAAGIGALCSVLYRPYLRRHPTLQVSALAMLASVLFLALLAWPEGWPARMAAMSLRAWVLVGFIGLSSAVAFFWWLYALKHESPTRVTVFLALNPVTAALLGALFLREPVDGWLLSALVLIAAGLWFATRTRAPQAG